MPIRELEADFFIVESIAMQIYQVFWKTRPSKLWLLDGDEFAGIVGKGFEEVAKRYGLRMSFCAFEEGWLCVMLSGRRSVVPSALKECKQLLHLRLQSMERLSSLEDVSVFLGKPEIESLQSEGPPKRRSSCSRGFIKANHFVLAALMEGNLCSPKGVIPALAPP